MASASKDETVIIWNMEKIKQNINKTINVDQTDYIITMIDEHEHVIDCLKFAPEAARKVIQGADYSKMKFSSDPNQTNQTMNQSMASVSMISADPNETGVFTAGDESYYTNFS